MKKTHNNGEFDSLLNKEANPTKFININTIKLITNHNNTTGFANAFFIFSSKNR